MATPIGMCILRDWFVDQLTNYVSKGLIGWYNLVIFIGWIVEYGGLKS